MLNLGVFIRLFALIIGPLFPAIAAPLFLNFTPLFAARWFAPKKHDIAAAIGSMSNPLGLAIGSLLPSLIVTDGSLKRVSPPEEHHLPIAIKKDRTHAYRLKLKILSVSDCVSCIYFVLILQPSEFYPLAISIGLMGFFLLPLLYP